MLAILVSHPIQYQIPLWQALAQDGSVPFEVWYLSKHGTYLSCDREFGKSFAWDLDMLTGYPYSFLQVNQNATLNHFTGMRLGEPINQLFRQKNVTALWVQGWEFLAYWQAIWQAYNHNIPVWLRGDSNNLGYTPIWKQPIKQFLLHQLFTKINHFLYVGTANRCLYESYGILPEKLHPAYHFIDNERFTRQAENLLSHRAEIRRKWHIPENAFCLLFAGKFIPKKRPFDLINAVVKLLNNNHFHLLFVGSGELGQEMRNSCQVVFDAEMPIQSVTPSHLPTASFAGFLNQTEISQAYVAADCLVLPSDSRETWGLVVNEALASGLPCVVSNACGCAEDLIMPLNDNFCFPVGDISALAKALLTIKNQTPSPVTLREQIGKFSIKNSVNTIRQLYQASVAG